MLTSGNHVTIVTESVLEISFTMLGLKTEEIKKSKLGKRV